MVKMETLRVLDGRIPRSIPTVSLVIAWVIVGIIALVALWALLTVISTVQKKGSPGDVICNLVTGIVAVVITWGVLSFMFWVFSDISLNDILLKNNKVLEVQVDTESEAFKNTIGTTDNLNRMIINFPEKEQKKLDYDIVNRDGKYYFSTLAANNFFEKPPAMDEVKDEVYNSFVKYCQRMNIYTPDVKVPDLPKGEVSEGLNYLLDDLDPCECANKDVGSSGDGQKDKDNSTGVEDQQGKVNNE